MKVCICNNVSSRKILDLKDAGYSFREIVKVTKLATQCGKCAKVAKEIYDDAKS